MKKSKLSAKNIEIALIIPTFEVITKLEVYTTRKLQHRMRDVTNIAPHELSNAYWSDAIGL